jgi:hypothetical protein
MMQTPDEKVSAFGREVSSNGAVAPVNRLCGLEHHRPSDVAERGATRANAALGKIVGPLAV